MTNLSDGARNGRGHNPLLKRSRVSERLSSKRSSFERASATGHLDQCSIHTILRCSGHQANNFHCVALVEESLPWDRYANATSPSGQASSEHSPIHLDVHLVDIKET